MGFLNTFKLSHTSNTTSSIIFPELCFGPTVNSIRPFVFRLIICLTYNGMLTRLKLKTFTHKFNVIQTFERRYDRKWVESFHLAERTKADVHSPSIWSEHRDGMTRLQEFLDSLESLSKNILVQKLYQSNYQVRHSTQSTTTIDLKFNYKKMHLSKALT